MSLRLQNLSCKKATSKKEKNKMAPSMKEMNMKDKVLNMVLSEVKAGSLEHLTSLATAVVDLRG